MSTTTRTFHRTEIKVVVLSEMPFDPTNLADVHHAITEGDCSGEWSVSSHRELTGPEAAKELESQGSDPGFFQLDSDGNDLE